VAPNPEFDLFALKDIHQQLRASAGALCETQIAPNFNCSQPLERPANRPQDQIPERAGPRGWRTGV